MNKKTTKVLLLAVGFMMVMSVFSQASATKGNGNGNGPKRDYYEWRETNGQSYLYVKAHDHYTLGYLEGQGLYEEILYLRALAEVYALTEIGITYNDFIAMAYAYEPYIPQEYKDEMQGMVDGINALELEAPYFVPILGAGFDFPINPTLTYMDLVLQNCFLDIFYEWLMPLSYLSNIDMGCTAFASKNDDGTILSQNFDFGVPFYPSLSWVCTDLKGVDRIFCLRMGGGLCIPCGIDQDGVKMVINVVETYALGELGGIPANIISRMAWEQGETAQEVADIIIGGYDSASFNMFVADDTEIFDIELIANSSFTQMFGFGNIVTHYSCENMDDVAVNSNTFLSERAMFLLDPTYSLDRQAYAEDQLELAKDDGIVTGDELLAIQSDFPVVFRTIEPPHQSLTSAFFVSDGSFGLVDPIANILGPLAYGMEPIYPTIGNVPPPLCC